MVNHAVVEKPIKLELRHGDHLKLKGPNGIGNTTVRERIAHNKCDGIDINPDIKIGYYRQDFSNLDFSSSTELGALKDTKTVYAALLLAATTLEPAVADYDSFKEFVDCENYAVSDTVELQRVFASYVENFYL